jgi:hypothetical protein
VCAAAAPDLFGKPVSPFPDHALGWAMDDVLEKQLERIEKAVAEILDEVKNLHEARFAQGEINPDEINQGEINHSEINQRLRRFLESKK